jgi:hypothetical protein
VSNPARVCAVWMQRAAAHRGAPVFWDYHVVARVAGEIRDPDCLAGERLPLAEWLRASFPPGVAVPATYRPRFRRCPAAGFLKAFGSDRRHMRDEAGSFRAPPPPWPPSSPPTGPSIPCRSFWTSVHRACHRGWIFRPSPRRWFDRRRAEPPSTHGIQETSLTLQTTTLWDYPSQHYGQGQQGDSRYVGGDAELCDLEPVDPLHA